MVASFASRYPMLALLALACLGADEYRPDPNFAGKSIPDPPRQKAPWTPPQTKLPRFLVSATAALFEQGMADPRGCEYREVEVGEGQIIKTRGFVLPERAGDAERFVVGWDAIIRPAVTVGAAADLDKDIHALADTVVRDHQAAATGQASRFGRPERYWWSGAYHRGPSSVENGSALKLCLLLRLGRADLSEALFAAATPWTPEVRGRDLTDYQVSYLSLAQEWGAAVYRRLIGAHMRGEDVIALDAARRLSAFEKAVEIRAAELGFERNLARYGEPPSYLHFRDLPALLADHERRAREPARGPIPKRRGNPAARVAALIRDLDQIDERQFSSPGSANPGGSPLVKALIAEGDTAVEPLLAAYETDTRLTRSVTSGQGASFVHSVSEAELAALAGILQGADFRTPHFDPRHADLAARKALVRSLRDFWVKNREVSPSERWYRLLRDDSAGRDRWLEAAAHIVQLSDESGRAFIGGLIVRDRPNRSPMKGEELRSRGDPSVSDLLARRVADIARAGNPLSHPNIELYRACELAMALVVWDEKAALPVLRTLTAACREDMERKREPGSQLDQSMAGFVARFTLIRAGAGHRDAIGEYAAWIRKCRPKELENYGIQCFEPMWAYPDDPAIGEAARLLFNDPQSPWVPLLRSPGGRSMSQFFNGNLYASPMVRVAGFRDGLLAAMAVKSEMGTVRRVDRGAIQYRTNDGVASSVGSSRPDLDEVKPGVDLPFRVCDYLAWQVSSLEGAPECEVYWPEERRDRAVAACAAFLRKYGDRFTADPPDGVPDFRGPRAHLAFPSLGRPATLDDVRAGRAIFALEGPGEVRLAKVPAFPIKARWITLKDFPVIRTRGNGTTFREFEQDGWIWQAEEVRKGDHWERSYGYVGPHVIARVPAAEIELAPARFSDRWAPLTGGLDVRVDAVEPRASGYEPDKPILLKMRIRNRRGVENTAPTEFLQRGGDGRPSLRRGVALALFYSVPGAPRIGQGQQGRPEEELKPKRTDHLVPGSAARTLGPFDDFEAMPLDLNDWFDLTKPGFYRLRITFAAESGVGVGASNDWYFTVGERQEFPDR